MTPTSSAPTAAPPSTGSLLVRVSHRRGHTVGLAEGEVRVVVSALEGQRAGEKKRLALYGPTTAGVVHHGNADSFGWRRTNANGEVTVEGLLPGAYKVSAREPNGGDASDHYVDVPAGAQTVFELRLGVASRSSRAPQAPPPEPATEDAWFQPHRKTDGATLVVDVVDRGGNAVSLAHVSIYGEDFNRAKCTSIAGAGAQFDDLPPGRYQVEARDRGASAHEFVEVGGVGAEASVKIRLPSSFR